MAEAVALLALACALTAAIVRHRLAPEAVVALAGAALMLLVGALSWSEAVEEAKGVAPTLITLAALLVLGDGCRRAGLFDALAERMAARSRGSATRLLALVFAAAAAVTAVLGLDATVVLLTPAAFAAASQARVPGRPHVYACTHLANSASLLLPVSNLTNLLAIRESGLSFGRFAGLMALPWVVAMAVEWLALRVTFSDQLGAEGRTVEITGESLPRAPIAVLVVTLLGFVATGPFAIDAAWPAAGGALLMLAAVRPGPRAVAEAIDVPLLLFVLGLTLIVAAVAGHGLGDLIADVLPTGDGLLALLGVTALAALAANVLNNVPALLVLLPAAAAAGPHAVLAVLIGVNCGPNLTYTGSLATLLWRRILSAEGEEPPLWEFVRLGLVSVPPILAGSTVALWLSLHIL